MKRFNILHENLKKESKLVFSIEVALVCLLFGSLFASFILSFLIIIDKGINVEFWEGVLKVGLLVFLLFLAIMLAVFVPMMGLAVLLRLTIYFLDAIKIASVFKLLIILTVGIGCILLIYYLVTLIAAISNTHISSLLITPYIFTFCFYTLYRNIWNTKLT